MTIQLEYVERFMGFAASFAVPQGTTILVSARSQFAATRATRIHVDDADHWTITGVLVGMRPIYFDACYGRADHFEVAVVNGVIRIGIIQAAEEVTLTVTPTKQPWTKDGLLFFAWLDGYRVRSAS